MQQLRLTPWVSMQIIESVKGTVKFQSTSSQNSRIKSTSNLTSAWLSQHQTDTVGLFFYLVGTIANLNVATAEPFQVYRSIRH